MINYQHFRFIYVAARSKQDRKSQGLLVFVDELCDGSQ